MHSKERIPRPVPNISYKIRSKDLNRIVTHGFLRLFFISGYVRAMRHTEHFGGFFWRVCLLKFAIDSQGAHSAMKERKSNLVGFLITNNYFCRWAIYRLVAMHPLSSIFFRRFSLCLTNSEFWSGLFMQGWKVAKTTIAPGLNRKKTFVPVSDISAGLCLPQPRRNRLS